MNDDHNWQDALDRGTIDLTFCIGFLIDLGYGRDMADSLAIEAVRYRAAGNDKLAIRMQLQANYLASFIAYVDAKEPF